MRALVFLVGFIADWWVPRTIDGGTPAPLATALAVDLALFLAFAAPHSLMARPAFKRSVAARGLPPALERSLYSLVSGVLLALLVWQWRPIPQAVWRIDPEWVRKTVLGLGIAGWLLAAVSVVVLRNTRLFGLSQGWRWARQRPPEEPALVTRGPYAVLRHPVYVGFLLGCWAAPTMSGGRLLLATASTLYVGLAWRWEERELARRFGDEYRQYRQRVGGWWPRLRRSADC